MGFKHPLRFGVLQPPLDPLGPGTPALLLALPLISVPYFTSLHRGGSPATTSFLASV